MLRTNYSPERRISLAKSGSKIPPEAELHIERFLTSKGLQGRRASPVVISLVIAIFDLRTLTYLYAHALFRKAKIAITSEPTSKIVRPTREAE